MKAAIFDMDGLLLDTEPLWGISMMQVARQHQVPVTMEQLRFTTGLRIYEVTAYWQQRFPWPGSISAQELADDILDDIIARTMVDGSVLPGVTHTLELLKQQDIHLGLATSSPTRMLQQLIHHFGLTSYFETMVSADTAISGKPHPEVYLQCAHALHVSPWDSVAFEDSVNGMIAAKAARMKVVLVPESAKFADLRFGLADIKLNSLTDFNLGIWESLKD